MEVVDGSSMKAIRFVKSNIMRGFEVLRSENYHSFFSVFVVSQSEPNLPLQIEDAMRRSADEHGGDQQQEEESGKEGGQQLARVKQDTKLGWANSVQYE